MHIALLDPEIPGNTGSIGRVCVGTATTLHLVGRLGFSLDEKYVRRAGLDYWPKVRLHVHATLEDLVTMLPASRIWAFTARGGERYDRVAYQADDILLFGCESKGLPAEVRDRYSDRLVRVPTNGEIRSLNLSNVATLALYEALRQQQFAGIE
jgi:tRNA (cytidine/uridine-2'-O-)-methyltransferase